MYVKWALTLVQTYIKRTEWGGGVNSETLFESFVSHSFIYNVNNDVPFFLQSISTIIP